MLDALRPIAEQVAERMAAADLFGRTVTLKIKHHDFTVNTRQHTLAEPVHSAEELMQLARWLLHTAAPAKPVRPPPPPAARRPSVQPALPCRELRPLVGHAEGPDQRRCDRRLPPGYSCWRRAERHRGAAARGLAARSPAQIGSGRRRAGAAEAARHLEHGA